ncbi:hypothetical protein OIV83_002081 [Microbotryomycetes sp. JL201]|nr:hypothetical protein OIV83_002081 [Microbotryomycetes sp. JL201]
MSLRRLNHPHYIVNALLCFPMPILLLTAVELDQRSASFLASVPVLVLAHLHGIKGFRELETVAQNAFAMGRLFNLIALVCFRNTLIRPHLTWTHVTLYCVAWMATSFFLPQPGYLGPTRADILTTEEFDAKILIVPPPVRLQVDDTEQQIREINSEKPDPDHMLLTEFEQKRKQSTAYHVVLFHVDWSRRSRELEIVIHRLSEKFTTNNLRFHIVTPDSAPCTFYDQDLVPSPRNFDLPVVKLFHKGLIVSQLPPSVQDIARERKLDQQQRRRENVDHVNDGSAKVGNEDESDSGLDSDEEREAIQETQYRKYKWDRSAASIEKAFKLRELIHKESIR